jgi:peptidoglycan/xylan/chitin deacetylase (PgdA/CDA1 family)
LKCRHCRADLSLTFLDLGSAPPSNAYLTQGALRAPEVWYPLRLLVCERCWLVQTEDHAGRESLFSDDYAYFSSFSSSWLAHAKAYVQAMQQRFGLTPASLVSEIAANDGYLLQYVKEAGIPCYGVEPTASTAAAARKLGLELWAWSRGIWDTDRPAPPVLVHRATRLARSGMVLLLHDGRGDEEAPDVSSMVEALPQIIAKLRSNGFDFVTLDAA